VGGRKGLTKESNITPLPLGRMIRSRLRDSRLAKIRLYLFGSECSPSQCYNTSRMDGKIDWHIIVIIKKLNCLLFT
jgi:hypothetical protein